MRSLSATESKLYALRARGVVLKVMIGSVEVTNLNGQDWVENVTFGGHLDQPLTQADLTVRREIFQLSLAPLNAQSKLNLVGGVFTPVVALNALVVVSTAVVPEGCGRAYADANSAWQEVFRGRIDSWDENSNPMVLKCRDISCEVADIFAEKQFAYAIGKQCYGVDVWAAGMDVVVGDQIVPSQLPGLGTAKSMIYICTQAGTTGTDEPGQAGLPAWPSDATVVNDGTAKWRGWVWTPAAWAASTAYNIGDVVRPTVDNGHQYIASPNNGATAGTSSGSQPTWPTTVGAAVSDGGLRWIMLPDNIDGGLAIELLLVGIMRDHAWKLGISNIPYVWTPVSPGYWRNPFIVQQAPLLEILRNLAMEIGWDIRLRWNPSATLGDFPNWGQWRLCFSVPDRAKTVADFSLTSDEYTALPRVETSLATIRNVISVVYSDPNDKWSDDVTPKRKTLSINDSASIAKYGRKYMAICAALSNNINSFTEANALAMAALGDLKDPVLEADVEGPYRWNVEYGDLVTLVGNWYHFTGDQSLAVYGVQHSISNKGPCTTRLTLRGKPHIGVMRWHEQAAGPGVAQFPWPKRPGGIVKGSVDIANTIAGARVKFKPPILVGDGRPGGAVPKPGEWSETELHVYSSPGTAPSSTTLSQRGGRATSFTVNNLRGGSTRYGKIVLVDGAGNRSPPSDEFTISPALAALSDIDGSLQVASSAYISGTNPTVTKPYDATWAYVPLFDAEWFDDGGWYSTTDNAVVAASAAALYVDVQICLHTVLVGQSYRALIAVNGSIIRWGPLERFQGLDDTYQDVYDNVAAAHGIVRVSPGDKVMAGLMVFGPAGSFTINAAQSFFDSMRIWSR